MNTRNKRKWLIMFYTFTDNNLEECTFKDFAKITDYDGDRSDIYMKLLIDTHDMGSYDITITGNPYINNNVIMTRRHDMNMSDANNFVNYINESVNDYPSENKMLILGGHGNGWFLDMEEGYDPNRTCMSSAKLSSLLRQIGVKLDVLCFDNCLMATIENVSHFVDIAKFITACEDYCPANGVINKNICKILNVDYCKMGINIINGFIESNPTESTDITLFDVDCTYKLFKFIKRLNITSDEFYDISKMTYQDPFKFCIDRGYIHLQDLYSFMEAKYKGVGIFVEFVKLFENAIPIYKQTSLKKNTYHHGISCIVYPLAMNSFDRILYNELTCTCILPDKYNKYIKCSNYIKSSRIVKKDALIKSHMNINNIKKNNHKHLKKGVIYLL